MTDICVQIYRCHSLYAGEYWFAVAVVVVAVIVVTYLPGHHWFRKWLGVWSAPSHYLEQYRSSETIGPRPKDILLLNKTKQTFYQVQFIWKQTRIQILHRMCASHNLNQWWLDVSWRFPNSNTILSPNVILINGLIDIWLQWRHMTVAAFQITSRSTVCQTTF